MQLILSIDDIGIKNNMSSAQETNRNEKEVKSPLIDKILSYSISSIADDSVEKEDQIVQDNLNSSKATVAKKEDQIAQDNQNSSNSTVAEKEDQIVQDNRNLSNGSLAEKEDQIVQDDLDSSNGAVAEKEDQIVQDNLDSSNGAVSEKEDQIVQDNQNSSNVTVVKEEDQIVQDNENSSKGTIAKEEVKIVQDNQNVFNSTGAEEEDKIVENNLNSSNEIVQNNQNVSNSTGAEEDDEIVEDNINSSNGTGEEASSLDALDSQENSKAELYEATDIENDNRVIQTENDEIENTSTEIETDFEKEEQEKGEDGSAVKQSEVNCDKNNDADIAIKSQIQDLDESHLENIESIGKKDEDDSQAQEVDLKQNDNVEEELKMTHESQLEDFETVSIENNVPENAANDSLEDKKDNGNDSKKNESTSLISEDIIDIADEKDSCDGTENANKLVENIPLDKDALNESTENSKEIILNKNFEDIKKSNHISVTYESSNLDKSSSSQEAQENIQNVEEKNNFTVHSDSLQGDKTDPTKKLMNFKLSNMLDILSDDEDNHTTKPESSKQEPDEPASSNKQCINIEEDDDIMLIDDESTTKENETIENNAEKTKCDSKEFKDVVDQVESKQDVKQETIKNLQNDDSGLEDSTKVMEEHTEKVEPEVKTTEKSPLLSTTTLKSFKKNLAEMTREELEDFCILKIVESVFDKSNLGEIKSQIKVMAQNIEEYKTKAKILTKQNRDLQVVLKSVQEEQKKNSSPITPLKITRSVGMQVLMTDKNSRKRQTLSSTQSPLNPNINSLSTTNNNKNQNKGQVNPNTRYAKPQQPIPVPRLIPAVNVGPKTGPNSSPQAVNNPGKSPTVNNIPNGVKTTPPAIRPEKRSHNKMQQNNSDTVDLTDDEPPAKVNNNNRNFNPSVRCVPPQNLLAPQRSPLPQNINSPKKVYIPISGPQSQNIRPGQTIMLKSVPTAGTRPRGPSNNMKIAPNTAGALRNARTVQRHPAPLPEFTKQYQPPNWKALPPAPELKLAKVENGIVISWKIDGYREENHEEIASYQLFAYQETSSPPNTSLWKKIGDVKALPLPMACTLTQFMSGYKYYFAVRAVDVRSRFGPFSLPGSILLLKNQ